MLTLLAFQMDQMLEGQALPSHLRVSVSSTLVHHDSREIMSYGTAHQWSHSTGWGFGRDLETPGTTVPSPHSNASLHGAPGATASCGEARASGRMAMARVYLAPSTFHESFLSNFLRPAGLRAACMVRVGTPVLCNCGCWLSQEKKSPCHLTASAFHSKIPTLAA